MLTFSLARDRMKKCFLLPINLELLSYVRKSKARVHHKMRKKINLVGGFLPNYNYKIFEGAILGLAN